MKDLIRQRIKDSISVKQGLLEDEKFIESIDQLASRMADVISGGGKLVICGNGGSASDALHFAGEIVGRFQKERSSWPAIVLNADVATLTAIANDYGYDEAFARQTEGHITEKDMFIGISTSGNSENVYRAVLKAKEKRAVTVGFLGKDGGRIAQSVEYPIVIPCNTTARVQEAHIMIIHILCEIVEEKLTQN